MRIRRAKQREHAHQPDPQRKDELTGHLDGVPFGHSDGKASEQTFRAYPVG